jgi:hypothetical protein
LHFVVKLVTGLSRKDDAVVNKKYIIVATRLSKSKPTKYLCIENPLDEGAVVG